MERLEEILKTQIKPQILRYSYLPYQMNGAMEIFKKIGQKRGKKTQCFCGYNKKTDRNGY